MIIIGDTVNIPLVVNYIDLGAGSLIVQFLVAGLFGALYLLKIYWGKVKAFLGRLLGRSNDQ